MATRVFDLNIEEVLENWDVEHALREIIANALDEQTMTGTAKIEISKNMQSNWYIRDFGRGLRIDHFTLKENKEKLKKTGIIGKFGAGLKDALATSHRRSIDVLIRSGFGTYRLKEAQKHGFDNIITLHVEYDDDRNSMLGTEFLFKGVTDSSMAKAQSLFLKFSSEEIIETNSYGQILLKKGDIGRVYIQGVFASDEPNFMFSYNITNLTEAMKKRLNRERLNVGRTTYAERVKAILMNASNRMVEDMLIEQVCSRAIGEQCDEMAWIDVSQMALNLLANREKVAYLTESEILERPDIVENAKMDGLQVVAITEQQKKRLDFQSQTGGKQLPILETYIWDYNQSFEYNFVDEDKFTPEERQVFDYTPKILSLVNLKPDLVPPIRISETMRVTSDSTDGVWDRSLPAIIIKRTRLATLSGYAATLLHEIGHATTGAVDSTREFENVLTEFLGASSAVAIKNEIMYNH